MRPQWDRKADGWDHALPQTELFDELLETVMEAVQPTADAVALDLGAGSGFLAIPLASRSARVYAVDHSGPMLERLEEHVAEIGAHVWASRADLRRFRPPEPVDIVVSNYALHHLGHRAKVDLVHACYRWMRPRGRIAISDIMVPLTLRPGQSGPLRGKLRDIGRRGPPGWWRIVRNAARWGLGRGEYPAPLEFWESALESAGFEGVGGRRIGNESGVAFGRKPAESRSSLERHERASRHQDRAA